MNPLDAILDAYNTARDAIKVVRRCATLENKEQKQPFGNTRFYGVSKNGNLRLLDAAESELNDLTVLSLYASFEKHIKDHLSKQAPLLHAAEGPNANFGVSLAGLYAGWISETMRMDHAIALFKSAAAKDKDLMAQVGNIRKYRHWVAHGKPPVSAPPNTDPQSAYEILSKFLDLAGLCSPKKQRRPRICPSRGFPHHGPHRPPWPRRPERQGALQGGDSVSVQRRSMPKSPFDVPAVETKATTQDILKAVRDSRRRKT